VKLTIKIFDRYQP